MRFVLILLLSTVAFAQDKLPDDFTVTSIKTVKIKPPKDILLLYPPHRCTMSTGVVKFEWNFKKELKKKKIQLVLEELDTKEKTSMKAKSTWKKHYMNPGTYRWRVVDNKNNVESRWRVFKVVDVNLGREVSAAAKATRPSVFVKNSPELPDYDDNDNELPKMLDHVTPPKMLKRQ